MNWSKWIRQIHRWLSIVFTATVIANFAAMALGQPPAWLVYSPLLPLFLLLFSGLYMFALPYAASGPNSEICIPFGASIRANVGIKGPLGKYLILMEL